jgi:hypothetical protein
MFSFSGTSHKCACHRERISERTLACLSKAHFCESSSSPTPSSSSGSSHHNPDRITTGTASPHPLLFLSTGFIFFGLDLFLETFDSVKSAIHHPPLREDFIDIGDVFLCL